MQAVIKVFTIILIFYAIVCCNNTEAGKSAYKNPANEILNASGKTVETRILMPVNYARSTVAENSFGSYLRSLPLKPHQTQVKLHDGSLKKNQDAHFAILDIDVGDKNLQQCADAVMRLRAEYLYKTTQYDKIHFNFTNGFKADYNNWKNGNRIIVIGNNASWKKLKPPSDSYKDFREYMGMVFSYAGTLSLSKELKPKKMDAIEPGDVIIRGGSPGHAVIVMDVLVHKKTKEKLFMLAQSYMPAQDIHILKNYTDPHISPWYKIPSNGLIETPEWTFTVDDVMQFGE